MPMPGNEPWERTRHVRMLAVVVALCGSLQAQSAAKNAPSQAATERLLGAWHLVEMEEAGAGGKVAHVTDRKGMLVYTRDGHMSVQLMFPPSDAKLSNAYVLNGYEASYGTYTVDEEAHTVTHFVQGSITKGLVGKELPRSFRFSEGHLIIQSTRPEEHWRVVWEQD